MTLSFIRSFFVVISGVVGYYIDGLINPDPMFGWMIGCVGALILILIEMQLRRVSVRGLSSMVFGLVLGIVMAKLLSDILSLLPLGIFIQSISRVVLTVIFAYLGAVMALRGRDEFSLIIPYVRFKRQDEHDGVILLDTSAVIDGRIAEVYKLHFVTGTLLIPRFVLQELQQLSDSADEAKRQKGRRGLEILKNMRQDPNIDITIHEDDLTGKEGVDSKLVTLAKMMDARICTVDSNLARVANVQSIDILNLNELAHALKPTLMSGEILEIGLVKEGKESHQAVGYLEDGTMIVVNEARSFIGRRAKVTVTSILQTQSGKMIFAKLDQTA